MTNKKYKNSDNVIVEDLEWGKGDLAKDYMLEEVLLDKLAANMTYDKCTGMTHDSEFGTWTWEPKKAA